MTGKGIVVSTGDGKAVVRIQKSSACGHDCGECNLCSNPVITTEILNPINAVHGDTVLIGTATSKVLQWAFMLYILPIIGAMAAYSISNAVSDNIIVSFTAVFVWLLVWFASIRKYSRKSVTMSCALEVIYEEN